MFYRHPWFKSLVLITVLLLVAVAYAIINIVVDIAYGLIDPRIRLGAEAREA